MVKGCLADDILTAFVEIICNDNDKQLSNPLYRVLHISLQYSYCILSVIIYCWM